MATYLPPVVAKLLADYSEATASTDEYANKVTAGLAKAAKAAEAQATAMEATAEAAATNAARVAERGELAVSQVQARADAANAKAAEQLEKATAEAESASARVMALTSEETASAEELDAALRAEAEAMTSMQEAEVRANQVAADSAVKVSEAASKAGLAARYAAEDAAAAGDAAAAARAKAAETADALEAKTAESSGSLATLGKVANAAFMATAAGAAAVGYESVKMAMSFDDASLHLVTDAGESQAALGKVKSGMLDVSSQTGISADQIASAMYLIESSGYHGAEGLTVLKAASEGAVVGGADVTTMANAVTSAMKAYGPSIGNATSVTNQLIAVTAAGKLHMQDLASSLGAVLPVAAAAHISFAQVGGAIAVMTAQGTTAQNATQHLAQIIRSLESPNAQAVKEMDRLGLSSNDVAQKLGQRGLTGTLEVFSQAITSHMGPAGEVVVKAMNNSKNATADMKIMLESMPAPLQALSQKLQAGTIGSADYAKAIKNMSPAMASQGAEFLTLAKKAGGFNDFLKSGSPAAQTYVAALSKVTGGAVGLSTALELTAGGMKDFKANTAAVADAATHASGDVQNWAAMQGNFKTQLDQAKTSLENVGIVIGNELIPPLSAALGFFMHHTTVTKVLAGTLIGLAAALSAVAVGLKVVEAAKSLSGAFSAVTGSVKLMTQGFRDAQVAESAFSGWQGTLGGSLRSVISTVAETASSVASSVASMIAAGATWVAETATQVAAQVAEYAAQAAAAVVSAATTAAAWVAANIAMIAATGGIILAIGALVVAAIYVWQHWSQIWGWIKNAAHDAWQWIQQHMVLIVAALGPVALAAYELYEHWQTIWADIKSAVSTVVGAIKSFLATSWADIKAGALVAWAAIKTGVGDVWQGVLVIIRTNIAVIKGIFGGAGSWLLDAGRNIIMGLVHGIQSAIGSVKSALSSVTSLIPSWKGPASVDVQLLAPNGKLIMQGLQAGIAGEVPALRAQLGGITASVPAMASAPMRSFSVGGLPASSGGGGGPLTATAPIVLKLDGKTLYQGIQTVALTYGRRNPTTGLSYIPGRA